VHAPICGALFGYRGINVDTYDLQARHAPFVFAILPVALVIIILVPGLSEMKFTAGSIAGLLMAATPLVAARFARAAGRARQNTLYHGWGGMPTTAMLRYRDERLSTHTKNVYRERLRRLGSNFLIPTEQDEQLDPLAADSKIAAAIDEIRRRAKERGIKAVHRENINYGAARNAYGLKPFGLAACGASIGALAVIIALRGGFAPTSAEQAIAIAIVVISAAWIFGSTPDSVRQHGEAYALALFEAIEPLTCNSRKPRAVSPNE
jgi:hypothetical protein